MKSFFNICFGLISFLLVNQRVNGQQTQYGMTTQSAIYIRSHPADSAEIITQTLLGMPVKILSASDGWDKIVTSDGYTGFITDYSVVNMDSAALHTWNSAQKLIVTDYFTIVRSEPSPTATVVADVVWGDVLLLKGSKEKYYQVQFPDGRNGYLPKSQAQHFDRWLASRNPTPENLVATAKHFLGFPYFWGGISTKGVDCSGFMQICYFLNGVIIQRNARWQAFTGEAIDISKGYNLLQPGDLLFFASKDDGEINIFHVGMYIGDNRFIQSAGTVHISSLLPGAKDYDKYNEQHLYCARRLLTGIDKDSKIVSIVKHLWYRL
jgi:cell wall-associated NlpC family hydrolase